MMAEFWWCGASRRDRLYLVSYSSSIMSFANFFKTSQARKVQKRPSSEALPLERSDASKKNEDADKQPSRSNRTSSADSDATRDRPSMKSNVSRKRRLDQSRSGKQVTAAPSQTKRRKKKAPATPESILLSEQLLSLSRQKKPNEAIRLYWAASSSTRDEHHACMVVDCCARCGSDSRHWHEEAQRVVESFDHPCVALQTALLKAYAQAGQLALAQQLFLTMLGRPSLHEKPNVRTLNTILRGCLWKPATQSKDGRSLVGGVVTSELAWRRYIESFGTGGLDNSSHEYSIVLLCQALHVEAAQGRIDELQGSRGVRVKGKASFVGGDGDVLETLAVLYLSLSRAHALLGQMDDMWVSCQRVLSAVNACRQRRLAPLDAVHASAASKNSSHKANGGKRAWKRQPTEDPNTSRSESNAAYREHRLKEIESDVKSILKIRGNGGHHPIRRQELWDRLSTMFLYFPPEEDDDDDGRKGRSSSATSMACWHSFGGAAVGPALGFTSSKDLRQHSSVLSQDGTIDLSAVFGKCTGPLDVELGAGYGDWIVRTAAAHPGRRHIAVEVRSDRAHQIFSKAALHPSGPLRNLCVASAEAGSFLRRRLAPGSVSALYVHHPEPPTQTYGSRRDELDSIVRASGSKDHDDDSDEPAHMLRSKAIAAAGRTLRARDGTMAIVTDNRNYGRLLCATVARTVRRHPELSLRGPTAGELTAAGLRRSEIVGDVALCERHRDLDHRSNLDGTTESSTWFDRLWTTGASTHAEQHTRFVVLVYRGV